MSPATGAQRSTTSFDSCQDDLDHLRTAAADAAEASEDAKSKQEDFEDCRQDPDTHDLMQDHCRSVGDDYDSALNELQDKMDDIDSKLRSVQDSCDYQFTINRLSALEASQRRLDASKRRLCRSYHKLLSLGVPIESVLKTCKTQTDERWCMQCLSSR
jgi:hypothetical protein